MNEKIEKENEIMVCQHCGKNGDEVTLEEHGKYIVCLDRNGNYEDIPESEYAESIYCYGCDKETELISLAEYKRIEELNLILENEYGCDFNFDETFLCDIHAGLTNEQIIKSISDRYDLTPMKNEDELPF